MRLNIAVANISLLALSAFQVDAFQTYPRHAFLSPSVKKTPFQAYHTDQRPQIKQSLIAMSASSKDKKSIDELYRIAMEEDEEWYNEFVRDVLGEENIAITSSTKEESGDVLKSGSESQSDSDPKRRVKKKEEEDSHPEMVVKEETVSSSPDIGEKLEEEKEQAAPSEPLNAQVNTKIAEDENEEDRATDENQTRESSIKTNPEDDVLVQYTDMYNNVQRVPMSVLSGLGYDMAGVARLQAAVLELIIDDEMSMPKEGLPRRWMVESRDSKEVKILKKRAPVTEKNNMEDDNRQSRKSRTSRSRTEETRGDRRERQSQKVPDEQRRGRSRPNKKAGMDDGAMGGESSTLWMDIPTFKQYLRREADLRLMIIGPDWEDWVKGESDWRLKLYKNWLDVVENGVGDDMMDEMSYVPDSEKQKGRPSRPRKRAVEGDTPRERRARSQTDSQGERRRRRSSRSNSDQRQRSRMPDDDIQASSRNERGGRMRRQREVPVDIDRPSRRSPRPEDDSDLDKERISRDGSSGDDEIRRPRKSEIFDTDDSTPRRRRARRKQLAEEDDYNSEPETEYRQGRRRERR